jgi:hypothetical protein
VSINKTITPPHSNLPHRVLNHTPQTLNHSHMNYFWSTYNLLTQDWLTKCCEFNSYEKEERSRKTDVCLFQSPDISIICPKPIIALTAPATSVIHCSYWSLYIIQIPKKYYHTCVLYLFYYEHVQCAMCSVQCFHQCCIHPSAQTYTALIPNSYSNKHVWT